MNRNEGHSTLDRFRHQLYQLVLGHRKDTMFELMEAALISSGPTTLVRLSLSPVFRRRWPSAPDGLTDGTLDPEQARALIQTYLPGQQAPDQRPLWALDGTIWPRPAAVTSPQRTWGHRTSPGVPQSGIVAAWEYQWLVAVPEGSGSWVLPLDVARRGPMTGTPTELALAQLQPALTAWTGTRPVVTMDSSYDPVALGRAHLSADLLIRLPRRRRFYREPPPYQGLGAPRKHGPVFQLRAPTTQGTAARSAWQADPIHGGVQVAVWERLHDQSAPDLPLTVVRVQVDRLPRSRRRPEPLWLVWVGGPLPDDLLDLWRWYARRFTIEQAFRFLKQDLGWTAVRPRDPEAADRWSWLLALAWWQLWLARGLVADQRLPWERPLPEARLTPGRVQRSVGALLAAMGTPARGVRPRGKPPGRQAGQCPGPRERFPVLKRRGKPAA